MSLDEASILTAMVTPFDSQGEIDCQRLSQLVEYLLAHHTEGLVIGATTGESPTLSHEEKLHFFKEVVTIVKGRVPVIANIGSNNTRESANFAKEVAKIEGIDAGLCVVPYYNKPNQAGLYAHFKTISEASDLPLFLYNVPSRTIASLAPETTIALSKLPTIIGTKECAGLQAIAEVIEKSAPGFKVYTGEDAFAFDTKLLGGAGVISVSSHVLGDEMFEMYQSIENGNLTEAAKIQRRILPKMDALFSVPSPAPVKAVLNHSGIQVGGVRLPLVACTNEEEEAILKIMNT
ncbi:4-hydroxy-tetrahydrodipicolinate synthase [Vagococcus entomophilus]|uniref:4-hydroxy-tetrahydrodipicolinate synthase n=1 Tax=Vagococcus entomophilus TaxID=1160095 RepID=A0A430AKP4_9ENTE|nr:4-hydroxy-tetrahydrodipicolinate synthase [Vagococcus entomophilus]RSU08690.1 4-hydroxy-tetrahydrodipicolinate synthase [Vagococcus entomophilus]